jgi:rSAM/selenodomain-associated transferase 1
MMLARHLVIFAKAPVLGRVKSRLAADIGWLAATAFQRQTLAATCRRLARAQPWRLWLAVTPDLNAGQNGLWPTGPQRVAQGAGDLGQRMDRAFKRLPPGPVVIIGSDIPDIPAAAIERAFARLGRNDVVVGPSGDGGYWLIGQRRSPRVLPLFGDIRWSSHHALADTLANLGKNRVALVEARDDIDDGAAWRRWQNSTGRQRDL